MQMQGLNPVAATAAVCSAVFWLVAGVIYVWLHHRDRTRLAYLNRLKHERSHVTREQFVAWFVERGVRHSVAAQAHDYLQQRCGVQDFPLAPDDSLKHVCDLDFDEDIADVLSEMGYREMEDSDWATVEGWDVVDLPSPLEPDAPVASFVHLIDTLHDRLAPGSETRASCAN
jgi:hypothetical protein